MSRVRVPDGAPLMCADVAKLADALDLGSSVFDMGVRVSSSAPFFFMREWLSGRASPCQGECRESESRLPLHTQFVPLAQLVEHMTFNHVVPGSTPGWGTNFEVYTNPD